MFPPARRRRAVCIAGCLLSLAWRSEAGDSRMANDRTASKSPGALTMTLTDRSVTQPIGPGVADPQARKFVAVEIAEVRNPKRIRTTCDVAYQLGNGERIPLGSFSLFPPDRPGRFIVATRGALRNEGAIVVTLQVLDPVGADDEVRVKIAAISLTDS